MGDFEICSCVGFLRFLALKSLCQQCETFNATLVPLTIALVFGIGKMDL